MLKILAAIIILAVGIAVHVLGREALIGAGGVAIGLIVAEMLERAQSNRANDFAPAEEDDEPRRNPRDARRPGG